MGNPSTYHVKSKRSNYLPKSYENPSFIGARLTIVPKYKMSPDHGNFSRFLFPNIEIKTNESVVPQWLAHLPLVLEVPGSIPARSQ